MLDQEKYLITKHQQEYFSIQLLHLMQQFNQVLLLLLELANLLTFMLNYKNLYLINDKYCNYLKNKDSTYLRSVYNRGL